MKTKITISLLVTASFLFITNVSKAQWTPATGYVYPTTTTDKVIIGSSTTPIYPLQVNSSNIVGNLSSGDSLAVGISHNTITAVGTTKGSTRHAVFGTTQVTADILFVNKVSSTYDYYERMRINRFGRVGIGTPTPDTSALLDISSTNKGLLIPRIALVSVTDAATITLPATSLLVYNILGAGLSPAGYYYNAGTSLLPNWVMFGTSNGWALTGNTLTGTLPASPAEFIGTVNAADWIIKTTNTERMRVLSGGNVGIGTTGPNAKLEVSGSTTPGIFVSSTNYPATYRTQLGTQSGAQGILVLGNNGTNEIRFGSTAAGGAGSIYVNNTADYTSAVAGTLAMYFKSDGNVGIGTTNPTYKLSLSGEIGFVGSTASFLRNVQPTIYRSGTSGGSYPFDRYDNLIYSTRNDGVSAYGDHIFVTGNGTSTDNFRMVIQAGGNVGIGTISPASKLAISDGISVGSSYSGTAAPSNGAIIQSNVGIGTSSPNCLLQVRTGTDHRLSVNDAGGASTHLFSINDANNSYTDLAMDANILILQKYSGGNVGIGTTSPGYKLDVTGDIHNTGVMAVGMAPSGTYALTINGSGLAFGGSWVPSDQQFKTNIDTLIDALSTIHQLKPKSFYFDTVNVYGLNFSNEKQYGFIAQDVEITLPELVTSTIKNADVDTSGNIIHPAVTFKTLNYNAFFGILTKGIQELKQKNDSLVTKNDVQDSVNISLQNQVNQLTINANKQDSINVYVKDQLNQLLNCCDNNENRSMQSGTNNLRQINYSMDNTTQSAAKQIDIELKDIQSIVLEQNVPNPFAEQTTINYHLPDNTGKAQILFYNAQGKLIQSAEIIQKGKGTLNVFASDLSNGIYTYTLVIDGKVVETKKMVKQ